MRPEDAASVVFPAPRTAVSPLTRLLGAWRRRGQGGPSVLKGTGRGAREAAPFEAARCPWCGAGSGGEWGAWAGLRGAGWSTGREGESRGSGLRSGQSPARADPPSLLAAPAALAGVAKVHSFPAEAPPESQPEAQVHLVAHGPGPPPLHFTDWEN